MQITDLVIRELDIRGSAKRSVAWRSGQTPCDGDAGWVGVLEVEAGSASG
jgi:hypothetical protein